MRSHLLCVIKFKTSEIPLIATATQIKIFDRFDKPGKATPARDRTIIPRKASTAPWITAPTRILGENLPG